MYPFLFLYKNLIKFYNYVLSMSDNQFKQLKSFIIQQTGIGHQAEALIYVIKEKIKMSFYYVLRW